MGGVFPFFHGEVFNGLGIVCGGLASDLALFSQS